MDAGLNSQKFAHIQQLEEVLKAHEKAWKDALAVVQREQPIVESLQNAIQALKGEAAVATPLPSNGRPQAIQKPAPTRKHEYLDLTAIEAIHKALLKLSTPFGRTPHIDRVVDEIYNPIPDRDVFYRIKRTLVSEAIRGMKKGLFVRGKKPNTFGIATS